MSRCHWNCDLENETALRSENGKCRPNTVEFKEAEREAILRKLDELKDQLSRTCDADEIKDGRSSLEPRIVHPKPHPDDYFQDQSPGMRGKSRQLCPENKHSTIPHCLAHCNESLPVVNGYGMTPHGYHPLMQNSGNVSRLEDSFESHAMRRPSPHWLTSRHQHLPSHPYSYPSGHYVSPIKDLHNQLSCSCYHCHEKRHQVPRQMPFPTFDASRVPHVENKPIIPCHHELPSSLGLRGCNSRACNASFTSSYGINPDARWPRDLDLDLGGFAHPRPQRVVLANGGLHCHPVAGGSPFITCHNCFQLLKLSKKVLLSGKSPWKICCGRCSSMICLTIVDGKLVAVDPPKKRTLKEVLYSSNEVEYEKPFRSCTDTVKPYSSSFRSEGYDIPGYEFLAADPVGTSEELPKVRSVSPSTSDDEDCQLELNTGSVLTNAAEIPVKATVSLTTSSSPIENSDDSYMYRGVNRFGKGSLSSRSDQERAAAIKSILRQNSLKESMATEMEEKNDFPEAEVPQDTMDSIREEDRSRGKRGIDAFLAGLIKKSFRDFSRSHQAMENGRKHVTVKEHVVPDRLINKAEKLAGPIYPGQYWYDYRAGFWGEMGGPCLGITPPFIEEFNYPMPENCANGDTGVFVNGRELHQKDLDLLVSRGLPSTRGRSYYIIDISGRVVDEDSSEELDNLGRLAPM
ncbi:Extra-large guanine nucleotide-binding protein 2-like protein [Drosera capensis]